MVLKKQSKHQFGNVEFSLIFLGTIYVFYYALGQVGVLVIGHVEFSVKMAFRFRDAVCMPVR